MKTTLLPNGASWVKIVLLFILLLTTYFRVMEDVCAV
jgi:hypothetical protein